MSRRSTLQAIVARAVDVGEADRFCILFSRERGKIAVRAPGARKMTSRMGGSLLPLRRVEVDINEGRGGLLVTGARLLSDASITLPSLAAFSRMEQGMEMLLALTEDDHPLQEVYDLTVEFLDLCCADSEEALPAYQLTLLHLLGLLPAQGEEPRFARLSEAAQAFVRSAATALRLLDTASMFCPAEEIARFRASLIADHTSRPFKSEQVAPSLEGI